MLVSKLPPVAELLPQDPPMVLIDGIRRHGPTSITCTTLIREGAPFVRGGKVAAIIALELMAQSTGVLMGIRASRRGGRLEHGLLLGSRELHLETDHFAVGDVLEIEAHHLWGDGGLANFECTVRRNGSRVAWGRVSVLKTEARD